MSNAVLNNVSAALGYDVVEEHLSKGGRLAFCYDFAIAALSHAPIGDESAPDSASTVLAQTSDTIIGGHS